MGAVYFYHLTRQPLEVTLARLLGRARGAGWRVAVRGRDRSRLEQLDRALWEVAGDDAFLPHGLAGGAHDADQPILLLTDEAGASAAANAPQCLMCIDAAGVDPGEVRALERVCILFDGHDTGALEAARAQWKALSGAGCAAQYWSEESGRWEKKAESGGEAT